VKDKKGDMLADSNILNKWKYYLSQLLNVHGTSNIRHIAIYTAKPLVLVLVLLRLKLLLQSWKGINCQVVNNFG
jgi:hypothetical protein